MNDLPSIVRLTLEDLGEDAVPVENFIEQQQQRIAELEYQLAEARSLQSYNHHIAKLKTENQELSATVERLQKLFKTVRLDLIKLGAHTNYITALDSDLTKLSTPQQNLAEHDAEVVEKAILSILEMDHSYIQTDEGQFAYFEYGIEAHAKDYAQRIRDGK